MMMLPVILCSLLAQSPDMPKATPAQRIEGTLDQKLNGYGADGGAHDIAAIDEATKAYKREIDRVYAKLLRGLPPAERASLIASQSAWEKYKEAELDSISLIDCRSETIHQLDAALAVKSLYRHRLEELNTRFDDHSDEEFETMPGDEDQPITLEQWNKDHARHRRPGQ
ncbi:MAG TPA: lysozyme inhibitor LprI family protein [Holophagaceae bacterium]|nr:lysozyme inhibitor LprI family protein [Holophagaceae bacterium]